MAARFLLRLAVALLLLAVLRHDRGLAAEMGEGDIGRTVVAVEFEADEPVDDTNLRTLVPVRVGEPLEASALDESKRLLEWKEVWSTVEVEVKPAAGGVQVVFHLVIKRTVSSVKVSGYETFYAEDLVRRVRIPSGAAMDQAVVDEAAQRLRDFYLREGFPDVKVSVVETAEPHRQVALDFHVEEGTPVVVSCIVIEGNPIFPSEDLAKSLGVDVGDRRTRVRGREVKRRALGFYRDRNYFNASVSVDWIPQADPKRGCLVVIVDPDVESRIEFVGNEALRRHTLLDLVDLSKRPVITDGTWRELGRRIASEYHFKGYYRAKVNLDLEERDGLRIIRYNIDEGRRYWIRKVEFVGNEEVSAATLEEVMQTRPANWMPFSRVGTLDDNVLNDDLRRIWFLYRKLGFDSAEVVDARTTFDDANESIVLTIEIAEGPRSIVQSVSFEGFEEVPEIPPLLTKVGDPFDPAERDADVTTLVGAVSRLGYPDATVQAEVEQVRTGPTLETNVHFLAQPGPARKIGPVIVQNNLITKDRVILRELPFEDGSPYDPQALIDGQTKVYRLGLFRRVNVRPLETATKGDSTPIGVEVDERPAGTLTYGLGYESDIGIRTFGEVAYDNLQGMDRRLSLRGDVSVLPNDPSQSQYVVNLGFRTPRVFGSPLTSRTNVIAVRNTQSLNRFSIEGITVAEALEWEIRPRFVVGGIVELDQADTFDVNPDANLAPEGVKDTGFLRQVNFGPFLELDRRDDPFAPRSGTIDTMRVKYAPTALGSDIRFVSLIGKHAQYIPLTEALTFVYALRGAWALPLDGKFSMPIRDRYFIGGRTTVRGFQENSVAPLGADGSPIGGDIMLNGNLELRFPLIFGFGAAIFLDSGGSFLRNECTQQVCNFSELDWPNFRNSAGLGLRYLTPVGPISLEYGFKIDRRSGESIGQFHFTIGNIF
jgi:outer membrane protein insertion porin family